MNVEICDGCGRPLAPADEWCPACGRPLRAGAGAPPGWVVPDADPAAPERTGAQRRPEPDFAPLMLPPQPPGSGPPVIEPLPDLPAPYGEPPTPTGWAPAVLEGTASTAAGRGEREEGAPVADPFAPSPPTEMPAPPAAAPRPVEGAVLAPRLPAEPAGPATEPARAASDAIPPAGAAGAEAEAPRTAVTDLPGGPGWRVRVRANAEAMRADAASSPEGSTATAGRPQRAAPRWVYPVLVAIILVSAAAAVALLTLQALRRR